ncbi:NUDIX hydrolase [Pseudooctadecabacter sp.]|uniref:NUDIX hydrolase n=1 Tax=Pseudooctadecabacter sp. TaxID=1966338 RepID=UPI0035C7B24A
MTQPGTKIILFYNDALVTILRDDIATIPYPDHWDLPGGGLDPGETPREAVLREVSEEIGLRIDPATFVWEKSYHAGSTFFAAPISKVQIDAIQLGDEGQRWTMMPVADFCAHPRAVPHFRTRVAEFWASQV